jgi:hypothetical protein
LPPPWQRWASWIRPIKNIGGATGFDNIEASASKVTLERPMSALDKLKAKFGGAGAGAAQGLGEIDRAGNKVTLEGPAERLTSCRARWGSSALVLPSPISRRLPIELS